MAKLKKKAQGVPGLCSASPQQTADSRRAQIYYPLHPLFGQAFWIRERRRGPPATYLVATESGEVFTVPVWMTQPAAANLRHENSPQAHVRALLEMAALMRKGLEAVSHPEEILLSDQAQESPRESRPTPIDVDTQSAPDGTASAASCQGQLHRAYRQDAGRPGPTRARYPRVGGGSR